MLSETTLHLAKDKRLGTNFKIIESRLSFLYIYISLHTVHLNFHIAVCMLY